VFDGTGTVKISVISTWPAIGVCEEGRGQDKKGDDDVALVASGADKCIGEGDLNDVGNLLSCDDVGGDNEERQGNMAGLSVGVGRSKKNVLTIPLPFISTSPRKDALRQTAIDLL
jgi:hypothetical protein